MFVATKIISGARRSWALSATIRAHLSLTQQLPNRDRAGLWCYFVRTSIFICLRHQAMRPSQGGRVGSDAAKFSLHAATNPYGSRNALMNFRANKTRRVPLIILQRGLMFMSDAPDEEYWQRLRGDRVPDAICRFANRSHTIRLNHPRTTARGCTNIAAALCRRWIVLSRVSIENANRSFYQSVRAVEHRTCRAEWFAHESFAANRACCTTGSPNRTGAICCDQT